MRPPPPVWYPTTTRRATSQVLSTHVRCEEYSGRDVRCNCEQKCVPCRTLMTILASHPYVAVNAGACASGTRSTAELPPVREDLQSAPTEIGERAGLRDPEGRGGRAQRSEATSESAHAGGTSDQARGGASGCVRVPTSGAVRRGAPTELCEHEVLLSQRHQPYVRERPSLPLYS